MNRGEVGGQSARIPLAEGQWTALLFFEPDVVPVPIGIAAPLPPWIEVGVQQQAGQLAGPNGAPLTKAVQKLRLRQVYVSGALRITFYAAESVCERILGAQAEAAARAATPPEEGAPPRSLKVVRDPPSNGHSPPA